MTPEDVQQHDALGDCGNRARWEVVEPRAMGEGTVWWIRTGRLVCGRHKSRMRVAEYPPAQ